MNEDFDEFEPDCVMVYDDGDCSPTNNMCEKHGIWLPDGADYIKVCWKCRGNFTAEQVELATYKVEMKV